LNLIYLHGFASCPESAKAIYLVDKLASLGLFMEVPNLNQGDFSHLTITRQLEQVAQLLTSTVPITLIGSSLGGLTAAWLAQKYFQVQRLVLLAPAFGFLDYWLPKLGDKQLQEWQISGYLSIYNYNENRMIPLHYRFVEDALQYQEIQLFRPVPTLIVHGRQDEVIPIQASRDYASIRPWVKLVELESDHALIEVMPIIWQEILSFCQLDI
jgi:uncharacterized protein